jgi:hypothetical protein
MSDKLQLVVVFDGQSLERIDKLKFVGQPDPGAWYESPN